jgi:hypothetical protein
MKSFEINRILDIENPIKFFFFCSSNKMIEHLSSIQRRREEEKAGGGIFENGRKCEKTLYFHSKSKKNLYLGHTKSSGSRILISYRMLGKNFFSYEQIERLLLHLSTLFDHYSIDIIIIKLSQKLFFVQLQLVPIVHIIIHACFLFVFPYFSLLLFIISSNN